MNTPARNRADPLPEVERRVLWLSTAIVHHANRVRPNPSGLKVGGHQASSASLVSIMTSLWFRHLRASDRVSVKPHASPVLHAINYLLGELDEKYLTTLREFGGLQSYPSRSKDPDPVDYSTGSVGIGATAPIWGAVARRYVAGLAAEGAGADASGAPGTPGGPGSPGAPGGPGAGGNAADGGGGRQYSLVGDAELDEGAVWEAILDPGVAELGEITWIVDLNRQSLDRVVPNIATGKLQGMFAAAGWQVLTLKYGQLLTWLFAQPGGEALRHRIDDMPNPEYQRLLRCGPAELRERLPGGDPALVELVAGLDDRTLLDAIRNLAGHDLASLDAAFAAIDDTRPTVIFAYTVKGYGLPTQGHPQNHSALLTDAQMTHLADALGTDAADPWARFTPGGEAARLCAATANRLHRAAVPMAPPPQVPQDFGRTPSGTMTTQAALGRALLDLSRAAPEVARRVVTVSPDVSLSTNLAGWVNKVGVWSVADRRDWFADDAETIVHWRERPAGQHIELGIAETNLAGLLGELGATWSRWGEPLLPIGVVYDPFVGRALEPWSFGIYAGGQSILVGTPSGVSLAPEGGAHQSVITPSIGLEQPGCVSYEPAFGQDLEWALLTCLGQLGRPGGSSAYLRLSTRPVDQALAAVPADPAARERRRRQVVAGGYLLRAARRPDAGRPGHDTAGSSSTTGSSTTGSGTTGSGTTVGAATRPDVTIVAMGVLVPEALAAASRLEAAGVAADVVCVTSPGLLFRALRARKGHGDGPDWILDQAFPADRAAPMVTVLDGHPHTLAFLAAVNRVPCVTLGVTSFGQSGDIDDVYRYHGIDTDSIIRAALDASGR